MKMFLVALALVGFSPVMAFADGMVKDDSLPPSRRVELSKDEKDNVIDKLLDGVTIQKPDCPNGKPCPDKNVTPAPKPEVPKVAAPPAKVSTPAPSPRKPVTEEQSAVDRWFPNIGVGAWGMNGAWGLHATPSLNVGRFRVDLGIGWGQLTDPEFDKLDRILGFGDLMYTINPQGRWNFSVGPGVMWLFHSSPYGNTIRAGTLKAEVQRKFLRMQIFAGYNSVDKGPIEETIYGAMVTLTTF